ncbi:MAG TPA: MarR family transcriptional regulator [Pirellulales bacterium]|nr:MarR family transcriptional regulator [Pirellulales bacterium]
MARNARRRKQAHKGRGRKADRNGRSNIELGRLEDAVGFNLRLAQEASFRAFAKRVGDPQLKPRWYAMLVLIRENPGLTQAELGRASGRDKSSITPALQNLTRRGLVRRLSAPDDARALALWLTPKGTAMVRQLDRHARAHDRMLERAVKQYDRAGFLDCLRHIGRVALSYSPEA